MVNKESLFYVGLSRQSYNRHRTMVKDILLEEGQG
jgi:hypothetical protein